MSRSGAGPWVGGSVLATAALRAAHQAFTGPVVDLEHVLSRCRAVEWGRHELDIPSLCVGLILGLALWPLLELVVLLKQWMVVSLRVRLQQASRGQPLYKIS